MKKTSIFVLVTLLTCSFFTIESQAQVPPRFLALPQHSSATADGALSILANPAGLGVENQSSTMMLIPYYKEGQWEDWGLSMKQGGLGFSAEILNNDWDSYRRYTWGLGGGSDGLYFGFGYSWTTELDRQNNWDIGMLARPYNSLSVGVVARGVNEPYYLGEKLPVGWDVGLAFRPFALMGPIGNNQGHRFTLSADLNLRRYNAVFANDGTVFQESQGYFDELPLKVGLSAEIIPGVIANVDYMPEVEGFEPRDAEVMMGMSFNFGMGAMGGHHSSTGSGTGYVEFGDHIKKTWLKPEKEKILDVTLRGTLVEYNRGFGIFSSNHRTVHGFHKQIEKFSKDPEIKGMIIRFENFTTGWAKWQEMRNALMKFKAKGKFIIVYSENYGNASYYLSSVADKIYLPPTGSINLMGIAANMMFLKGTFEKIGIEPEFEHIGKYKSASDMFTREDMSDAQREAMDAILDDLYDNLTQAILHGYKKRGIDDLQSESDAADLINEGPFSSSEALEFNLIDSLIYEDQLHDVAQEYLEDDQEFISERKYYMFDELDEEWDDQRRKSIAIVYGTGAITSGNSSDGGLFSSTTMGSKTISKAIRNARNNKDVAAIVFRVDSPGGSALASELILREVKRTTEGEDAKPIIVSMSDVAGSGGYYVACQADKIVALPNTITGSIGVISGKFVYSDLQEKIGVNSEALRRGEHADMYAGYRGFTEKEWTKMRTHINHFYQTFLERVAEGRDMDTSAVHKVAQGRIWSGTDAKENGLVDEIGGLDLAIEIAAQMGGIKEGEEFDIKKYPSNNPFEIEAGINAMVKSALPESIVKAAEAISSKTQFKDGEVLYLIPFDFEIE